MTAEQRDRAWRKMLDHHARGDVRRRCETCDGLICDRCGYCNGEHYHDGDAWQGKVSTDKRGRTLHRECRYDLDELGMTG